MERIFCVSDNFFSGFETTVDLLPITSLEEIINEVKYKLYFDLKKLNLDILCKKLEKINFHIHDFSLDNIFTSDPAKVFYICSHEHNT